MTSTTDTEQALLAAISDMAQQAQRENNSCGMAKEYAEAAQALAEAYSWVSSRSSRG
jgi:hypothetical protein